MTRREEKMRAEKEKMMQEEDPDRQRRLEVNPFNTRVRTNITTSLLCVIYRAF